MATLVGGDDLKRRLKALGQTFKPLGRSWAEETVRLARPMVPVDTGRLRESHRVKSATARRAVVEAHYTSNFVDAGAKPHLIVPKRAGRLRFKDGGNTVFARKARHPGVRARPYKARAAQEALRRTPLAETLIDQWNRSA